MDGSIYLKDYLIQSELEIKNQSNPEWLKSFFKEFSGFLQRRVENRKKGDRYLVSSSFRAAFKFLIPESVGEDSWGSEISLERLVEFKDNSAVSKMLRKKRVDFVVFGERKNFTFEFKTNLQFNDLAAAMVEMAMVRKYKPIKPIVTASIHLFPYRTNVQGLREMNAMFHPLPLNRIWVFCKGPKLEFDVEEIKEFREVLISGLE